MGNAFPPTDSPGEALAHCLPPNKGEMYRWPLLGGRQRASTECGLTADGKAQAAPRVVKMTTLFGYPPTDTATRNVFYSRATRVTSSAVIKL